MCDVEGTDCGKEGTLLTCRQPAVQHAEPYTQAHCSMRYPPVVPLTMC